jgi:hypothetical protein
MFNLQPTEELACTSVLIVSVPKPSGSFARGERPRRRHDDLDRYGESTHAS